MSDLTDNAQIAELKRRAEREAANVIARHNIAATGDMYSLLVSAVAIGWLEGREDGLRSALARFDAPAALHSVKVTP